MSGFGGAVVATTPSDSGLFGKLSERFEGAATMAGPAIYAIWVIVIGLVIALVLLIIDYFYPFLPFNPVGGPSSLARASKTFWKSVQSDTENLVVPATDSPTVDSGSYTVSVQLAIADSRVLSDGKYRHILHRGSNPVGLTVTTAGPTGHSNIQPSDLPQPGEPTYNALGLPQVMNPGVFLDKYKNDIHIFIHTQGKEDGMQVMWLESLTIEDLPMASPLTLGIVCTGTALEVYVNCRLYSTIMLRGTPYLAKADNQWFGRYGAFPFTGIVKNLTLWSSPLGSSDYVLMCRQGGASIGDLPESCPTKS